MYKNRMQVRMIIILIFHCSIILFVLVKEDLHVWNNFWRGNFYDNFQM